MSTETFKRQEPTFSVICLTYNHAAYIEQCINSVIQQLYKDWELLILDDGSTDGIGEKISPYLKDHRIKYFSQENKGSGRLAENYNFLLSKARGTYITILEGDDFAEPELLNAHLKAMEQNTDAVLSFNQVWVGDPGHFWVSPQIPDNNELQSYFSNTPRGAAYNLLFYSCYIPAQGVTLRREILLSSGGFEKVEGLPTVDYPTWLKLATLGPFVFVPETLAHWRRHENQTTKLRIFKLYSLMVPVFEQVYDGLSKEIRENVKVPKETIIKHWAINLTKILIRGGNYQLQARQWEKGRALYYQSFKRWPKLLLFWRMKAVLGITFSWLHIPWKHWYHFVPERILKLF